MTFRAPHLWLSGILLTSTVLGSAMPAEARRQLVPNRPSVELNLDVLQRLRHRASTGSPSGLPFARGTSEAVKRQSASVAAPAPVRRMPPMNPASVASPVVAPAPEPIKVAPKPKPAPKVSEVKKTPPKPVLLPPPPMPISKPVSVVEPAPELITPQAAPEPIVQDPFEMQGETAPMPEPISAPIPEPEPIVPLPEPDMEAMTFDDFPELEPLPEVSFDAPDDIPPMPAMEDIPAPEVLPELEAPVAAPLAPPLPAEPMSAPEPMPVIAPPMPTMVAPEMPEEAVEAIPELPAVAPLPEMVAEPIEPAAPELAELPSMEGLMNEPPVSSTAVGGENSLPSLDVLTGEVSAVDDASLTPLPEMEAMPELPAMSDVPASLPSAPTFDSVPALVEPAAMPIPEPAQMASLPTPDTMMPAIAPPAPIVASDGKGFTIQFAETENDIPVSAQSQLASLAESLKGSDKKVIIRPYVDNVEESSVSNVIGARRSFAIRSYLIDKGMERFNITIDRNQESAGGSPERVELVVQ